MIAIQITNPIHREYIEERGNYRLAEQLGLILCGACAWFDCLTIVDSDTRTCHFHRYAGSVECRTVPVCDEYYQQGACDEGECLDMMEDHHHCSGCIRSCTDPGCLATVRAAMLRRVLPDRAFDYESFPSIYNLQIPPEKDWGSAHTGEPLGSFHVFATTEERDNWVAGPCRTVNRDGLKFCNRIAVEPAQALAYVSTSAILEV